LFKSPSRTIQTAIALAINAEFKLLIDSQEIALEICYPKYGVHYSSVIALAISHRLGIEAIQIAKKIAKKAVFPQWQIQAFGKGWLNISLSNQFMIENLSILVDWQIEGMDNCDGFWQKRNMAISPNSPEPILQYAYARCCALIRLAHRENLCCSQPEVIEKMESVEISLLMQILAIADYLENENILTSTRQINRQKLSRSLAVAFLQFYNRCRIFGVDHAARHRRMLLLRITQKFLVAIAPSDINYAMYL